MNLLHDPPSGFDGVAKAFAMARHLPPSQRAAPLQVGLVHEGVLVARGELDAWRQVPFLAEHLRELGWREHLLGEDDEMFGCDLLFSLDTVSARDDDPSFIRRTPVELWGDQHAGKHQ
jgi:hypothetical protein